MEDPSEKDRATDEVARVVTEVEKDFLPSSDDDPSTSLSENAPLLHDTTPSSNLQTRPVRSRWQAHRGTIILVVALCIVIYIDVYTVRKFASYLTFDPQAAAWQTSNSSDGALNLVRLYPKLEDGASEDCKLAWETVATSLPCHRNILSPAFDRGNATEVREAGLDPVTVAEQICPTHCFYAQGGLLASLRARCSARTDRFNLTGYGHDGLVYFDRRHIEDSPLRVAETLDKRVGVLCKDKGDDGDVCSATLWNEHGIVQGIDSAHINGVREFIQQNNLKTALGNLNVTDLDPDMYEEVLGSKELETFDQLGHGDNKKPSCGSCTAFWLMQKFSSFEVGKILDPRTGQAISRPDYFALYANAWGSCNIRSIWLDGPKEVGKAQAQWVRQGWWCGDQACDEGEEERDVAQRSIHGLSPYDEPLPHIRHLIFKGEKPRDPLVLLHYSLLHLPCSIPYTLEETLTNIMPHQQIISHICSDTCRNAVDRLHATFQPAFEDVEYMHPFAQWSRARDRLEPLCSSVDRGYMVEYCAPGYAALDLPGLPFRDRPPPRVEYVIAFERALKTLVEKMQKKPYLYISSQLRIESIFNYCARRLLVGEFWPGHPPSVNLTATIDEHLNDPNGDRERYAKLVKAYLRLEMEEQNRYTEIGYLRVVRWDEEQWSDTWRALGLDVDVNVDE